MVKDTFTFKYRPKKLSEFNMSEPLRNVLYSFIHTETFNIILTGNTGTGKTSIINAIISEYYDQPIDFENNQNILSINILKEQGISYYRSDVRSFCQTSSSIKGKRKILLFDDIDIINEQSQQVFRNCIDKYNHNVCFIASCTNLEKVIDSLQSRMDIVKIQPPTTIEMTNIAKYIISKEHISLDDNVLTFIVLACNGSIRILINYLEKFALICKHIDLELATQLCTNISYNELGNYTTSCLRGELRNAIYIVIDLINKGYSVMDILDCFFSFIKYTSLLTEDQKYIILPYICKYITIFHNIHEDEMELIFFTNNLVSLLA